MKTVVVNLILVTMLIVGLSGCTVKTLITGNVINKAYVEAYSVISMIPSGKVMVPIATFYPAKYQIVVAADIDKFLCTYSEAEGKDIELGDRVTCKGEKL